MRGCGPDVIENGNRSGSPRKVKVQVAPAWRLTTVLQVPAEAKGQDAVKHPGPWKLGALSYIRTPDCKQIARILTDDPETRAILTHAAEMWEAVQGVASVEPGTPAHRLADRMLCVLANKIESEIAAAKGDGI